MVESPVDTRCELTLTTTENVKNKFPRDFYKQSTSENA